MSSEFPVLINKVTSPHYVTPTLRRPRLLDWLAEHASSRAIVINADAGYGKTTLLWQFEREAEFPCYWYKLDRTDRDWSFVITYLIESIRRRHEGFGERAISLLRQTSGPQPNRSAVAAYLISEMQQRLTEPCTFLVDDWQYVEGVTEVRALWNQLLRDAPPTCRFIFASRGRPRLQFARFKTHGGFAQLTTNDLRFTDGEIEQLFREIYADPLGTVELHELERRTEGWAASLQLIEVSLRERPTSDARRQFIQSIGATSDSDLFAYLAEEVLDGQPENVRNFLLTTSILQQLTPELAERLAGVQDGPRVLAELEQQGLFTYRLDVEAQRYRYHHLFRDFLERRLTVDRGEPEVTGLHIHAASYFETHARWPEAIHHFLRASLHRQAARLIARHGEDIVAEGRLATIDQWLSSLPARTIEENARLCLLYGETRRMRGDWAEALRALQRARGFFARKGDPRLEALACLKLSSTYLEMADFAQANSAARDGLERAPAEDELTRMRLAGNAAMISAHLEGNLADAADACLRLAVRAERMGLDHYVAIALHNLGIVQRSRGYIDESVDHLKRAAALWDAVSPRNPYSDHADLVESLVAAGRVADAERYADAAVANMRGWPLPYAIALYGRSTVDIYAGNFARAVTTLRGIVATQEDLGPTAANAFSMLFEALTYADAATSETERVLVEWDQARTDRRGGVLRAIAHGRFAHLTQSCIGECASLLEEARWLEDHGYALEHMRSVLDVGRLRLEHADESGTELVVHGLESAIATGVLHSVRWPARALGAHLAALFRDRRMNKFAEELLKVDPSFWRDRLVDVVPATTGTVRMRLLESLVRFGGRDTARALNAFSGADVAEARHRLLKAHAPRLFIRTLGALRVHRGGLDGPEISLTKRRLRSLLGLLLTHIDSPVTRDTIIDTLWPDAATEAGVNSLNQSVFQLRRTLDPTYRDTDSPQYIVSTPESVSLDTSLVRTDLQELQKRFAKATSLATPENLDSLLGLIRGEFLEDLSFDDWTESSRASVREELRRILYGVLDLAGGNLELSRRAAAKLVEMDEYDEAAQVALVKSLLNLGRRAAARTAVQRFSQMLRDDLQEEPSHDLLSLVELRVS